MKQAGVRVSATTPLKPKEGLNGPPQDFLEGGGSWADGSLGELLRSGAFGETIREKIRSSILSALHKGTNLAATLPPAVQGYVTIQNAEFKDAGEGNLLVVLDGEARIPRSKSSFSPTR
jgi:hypothetical protein